MKLGLGCCAEMLSALGHEGRLTIMRLLLRAQPLLVADQVEQTGGDEHKD